MYHDQLTGFFAVSGRLAHEIPQIGCHVTGLVPDPHQTEFHRESIAANVALCEGLVERTLFAGSVYGSNSCKCVAEMFDNSAVILFGVH